MRTTSRIRINEHDSAEELSSYTESDSPIIEKESPVIKRESSPWFPPSKIMDEKVESKKKDTNAVTEAHPSSDILNMSDFPPIHEAGTQAIHWEHKSGDRKRKLRGEDEPNKENNMVAPSSPSLEYIPTPLCGPSPQPLMSPLQINEGASVISISSDDEERKDRNKRNKRRRLRVIHQHFHLPGEWAAVNIYVGKRRPEITVDGVSIHDIDLSTPVDE